MNKKKIIFWSVVVVIILAILAVISYVPYYVNILNLVAFLIGGVAGWVARIIYVKYCDVKEIVDKITGAIEK